MRPLHIPRDPRALAALMVAVLGCLDVILGVMAPISAPTVFWPLGVLGGHIATMACGLMLLYLAAGLRRGLRAAWVVTLVLLPQVAMTTPVDHDAWALLALLPLAVLWVHRKSFAAAARASRRGSVALLTGLAVLLLTGSALHEAHGVRAHGIGFAHIARAADSAAHVKILHHGVAHDPGLWMAVPGIGVGALIMLVGLRGLTLPGLPRLDADKRRLRALAGRLFDAHGTNGVSYFAAAPGKTLWADPNGCGGVAFRLIGATALVVGDPLAAPDDVPGVLEHFLTYCRANGWTAAFYQSLGQTLPLYRAHGLRALAIGREAIIDLPTFTLTGKRLANVRHSVTHAERAGMRVRLFDGVRLGDDARNDLRAISAEWLAGKRGEMGFTMGQLASDGRPTPGARVAIAYDDAGRAQAFITLVPAGGGRGWMLDLMRRRCEAVSGTMDLLIARTAEALRDEGAATFSLSLAPMASGEDDDEDAPAIARRARAAL